MFGGGSYAGKLLMIAGLCILEVMAMAARKRGVPVPSPRKIIGMF
jgi:hypothetical protein